ncbi:cardiomyopathy-associated protein 5 [Amblyraja radiata]|uniref:cardiomyopathy-associated protein 5 n=1 Tax=Amblyraja radiata TaxID=386614 RepID=UPI001403E8F2|nr:cardiomyopathy-associated protein 5 [Amblyraja radiata]
MESLGACTSAQADALRAEMSSFEEEVCEVDAEEEEELGESLKDVTTDKSVKPKVNCIMSSSSFTMLTVQGEDSGIIWETVSSSRCSTPWASESTVSDANSVESNTLPFPPGKVIFITDQLTRSSAANGHRSSKRDKSGKRRVEAAEPRPGDAVKIPRNNVCVARGHAGTAEPAVILGAAMDSVTNSRLVKDSNESEGRSESPLEHGPTLPKIAGKSYEDGNVSRHLPVSVEEDIRPHAPVHCRKKRHLDTVSPNEQSATPGDSRLNNLFSTTPEQHLNISPAKLSREPGESQAPKRFSDTGLSSALHERSDSRLPSETSPKPMRVSRSKETCKGTEYVLSPSKAATANGTICTGKGELQTRGVTGSSSCHETSIPEGVGLEVASAALEHASYLNRSPTGLTLKKAVPHHFPRKQEVVIHEGQTPPMTHPEIEHRGASTTSQSELIEPLANAELGVGCKDVDNFVPVIKDEGVEALDGDLQHSSLAPALGNCVDWETPHHSARQEAKISDKLFYSRANPDLLEALDVDLNGSFHGMCRAGEKDRHSLLVGLEDAAGKLHGETDREIQRAAFNIVAEGSEILNIIAPASYHSVDQEACSNMQKNLTYLQANPIIKRKDFEDENSLRLLGPPQHSNPLISWNHNPFTIGKSKPSSVEHSDHFQVAGPTSNLVGSNPSDGIGTNPTHGNESNPSHEFGSNPSQANGSNPSHGIESNSLPSQTPNPSTEAAPNSTSAEQSTAVATASTKSRSKEVDYFEKYTLVDELVPIEIVATEDWSLETLAPGLENPSVTNRDNGPSSEDTKLFNFDEFDMSGNAGSCILDGAENYGRTDLSVQARTPKTSRGSEQEDANNNAGAFYQKEAGSLLFDTTEGILSRSHDFPISTKLIDIALLEEPPALAFYYKDLYEEAKGRREQNNEQSDEDGSNPEFSFPCQSSDTEEGNGLYFEKYVLKDDILESMSRVAPQWAPVGESGQPLAVAIGAKRLFTENHDQFPAIDVDEAGVPGRERDSEKAAEVQQAGEEEPKEEDEAQKAVSEPPSIQVSEEAGSAIEMKEENFNEMSSEEVQATHVSPPEETFHAEDIMSISSDVEEHSDTGHLANINHSFEEYGVLSSEPGLEDVNAVATLEMKDTLECISKDKTPVCPTELEISKEEQSGEQGGSEEGSEVEDEAELEQEADQEGLGEPITIQHKAYDQISEDEPMLVTEELAPQMLTEEDGDTVHTMGEEVYKSVSLEGEQLCTESTETTGASDAMGRLQAEVMDLQTVESTSKEKTGLETESQGKPVDEGVSRGKNDVTTSEVNDDEMIPDLAGELQEGRRLADDFVLLLQGECETTEVPTHTILPDVFTYEQDSRQIFEDIPTEEDPHGTISKIEDHGVKPPQEHYHQDIIHDQADDNIETHLHEDQVNLLAKDTEEESTDFILPEDVNIIEDENSHPCLDDLEIVDKEVEEINQKETEELNVQTTKGEDAEELITPRPAKSADTYCVTCGFPIFAIDKLFGEHQDHDVIAIDTAVVKVKEKLDDFVKTAGEKASRIEEFVAELEDSFNAVEENCTKEEKYLEDQHDEVMKLLLSQYTEMSQVLEEEKKMKLEHLCDQMVNYRCNIDFAKETAEKTRESVELDDVEFLKSFKMINGSVISAFEAAISLDLKPKWCSSFDDVAIKSSRCGFESLKNLPVPHSPTVVPQEPNTATSTTITVYWTVAEDDVIDYFQVFCMDQSEGSGDASGTTAEEYKMAVKESYCTLDSLEPSRCYLVWVMAVNFAGCSLPSEKVTIQTVPAAPLINSAECTVSWDSATIRWTTAGDLNAVDFFILEFHRQNDLQKSKFRSVAGIRGCEQTVSLPPMENFLFFVKAVNSLGPSDISKPALISTKSTRFHLNKETAPPNMQLSEDGTVIHFDDLAMEGASPLSESSAVLGETLPARGRHYWEVRVDRCEAYRIGVVYPVADIHALGTSNTSWCMRYFATPAGHRYEFIHDSTLHDVLLTDFTASVGVFADCGGGLLSFFNAHNGQLLHTFRHQFVDFICPAFVVEKPGFLSVCTGVDLPEFAKHS